MIIFLGIGFFFIYWFLLKLDASQKAMIWQSFLEADYLWVIVAMLCSLLSHFFRALRWQLLFQPIGFNPNLNNTFGSVVVAYMANLAFPRAGEVMRCATLRTSENIPIEKSLGTVVTERIIDILSFFIIVAIGIALVLLHPQWLLPAGITIEAPAIFPLFPKVILLLIICFMSLCITGLVRKICEVSHI